ncbi:MAG TPA: GGDEF domain-containing protein [Arenimonas sp.]|uniref:GGDEF domain-containing protein n=1 Tax=Arenimonas sp. TaxID=1872635 RepID=UPI002CFD6BBD|nr:GGDEF domain-containing protein [Arenimonas sp.]HMB58175.1 GGDEF domain-containing protein [Arenimonas sp.]
MPELFAIDPRTVFLVAMLMMLLNGGVLGLMHGSLAPDVQPSAFSWRVGTLLQAAGCVLQAVQQSLPPAFVLPLANALLLLGMTAYLRALRQFYGLPERWSLLLPPLLATVAVFWFTAVHPDLGLRITLVSLTMAGVLFASARTLQRFAEREAMTSRAVLAAIFLIIAGIMFARAVQAIVAPPVAKNLLQLSGWQYSLGLVLAATLPVIGTTAFLLMCLERIRGQWQRAASTDYLTGLANRRTVALAGERAFHAARRQDQVFAVAVLDVDFFKAINDRHGHDVGDLALKHLAALLEAVCRKSDLPGRLGGEEFFLLLDRADRGESLAVAERFQQQLRAQPLRFDGVDIPLAVSIGVAVLDAGDRSFAALLRRADQALYAAKSGGRNRVELAEPGTGGAIMQPT